MGNRFKIRRGSVSPVNAADIENYELVYNYTDNELWTKHGGSVVQITSGTSGTVTNVVAGAGLTGGGTSTATLDVVGGAGISVSANAIAVSGLTVSEFAANSLQLSTESFADNNTSLMTSAAIADKIEAYGYSTGAGTVDTSGSPVDNDYAKFTDANTLEGMSIAEMKLDLNYGTLADLDSVGASQITDNSVGAAELNVSGNGSVGHVLKSDGDGSFSWVSQTDTNTTYTASTGLDLSGTAFSVDVSDFMSNGSNNRILTATGTDAMNAEAGLTYDGTYLSTSGTGGTDGAAGSPIIRLNNTTQSADWDTGDVVGTLEYYAADASGNAPYVTSFIKSVNGVDGSNGTLPSGALTFGVSAYNAVGGAVEKMRIDSTGNVGIGTTSPDATLQIGENSTSFTLGTTSGNSIDLLKLATKSTNENQLIFSSERVADGSTWTTTRERIYRKVDASDMGYIDFGSSFSAESNMISFGEVGVAKYMGISGDGRVTIGPDDTTYGVLTIHKDAHEEHLTLKTNYSNANTPRGAIKWRDSSNVTGAIHTEYDGSKVNMHFGSLYNSGYNTTSRMVLKGDGNVGIGTTSPNRLLHLQSTGDAIMQITSADGSGAYIDLGDVSDVDGGRIVYDSGSNLLFNTASTERVRISSNGNMIVGSDYTTNASTKLVVSHSGANGILLNQDAGTPANSGRLFFEGTSTSAIFQEGNDMSFRSGATTGSSSGTERFKVNTSGTHTVGNITVSGTVDGRDVASDGSKLDGIEASATADQTAAQILTAIKTVDGAGSGLDADLLDGIDSGAFLRSNTSDTIGAQLTMGTQTALVASNYGHGVFGVYSASKYQHVWSMGTAYKGAADGASTGNIGNLYGLAWSYNPDYGAVGNNAQSKTGLGHQLLLASNGLTKTALGTGIWTQGHVTLTNNKNFQVEDAQGNIANLIKLDTGNAIRLGDTTHVDQIAISTAATTNAMIFQTNGTIALNGNVTMSSPATINYGLVVNEGGHNNDFRVESENQTHALHVDANLDQVKTYALVDTATGFGNTSGLSLDTGTNTPAEYAALPIGYSRMMHANLGTDEGMPLDAQHVLFNLLGKRDSGGGWNALAQGYNNNEQLYIGHTTVSGSFATWSRIVVEDSSSNINPIGNLNLDAGKRVYFDGGDEDWIMQNGDNIISTYVNGNERLRVADSYTYMPNKIYGGDGTAAAPMYNFWNDSNTGMYRKAADSLGFSAGGTERVFIDSTKMMITGAGVNTFRIQFPNDQRIFDNGGGGLKLGAASYAVNIYSGTSSDMITFHNGGISGAETARITPTGLELANTKKLVLDGAGGNTYINQNSGSSSRLDVVVNGSGILDIYNTGLKINGYLDVNDIYVAHGGSDYSPGIIFLGGSDTPGSNAYENATIGYYDNSGTGNMLFKGNRGAMNWHFNDSDETLFLMASSGDFHAHQDVVAYSTSAASDKKFKENIKTISYGLEEVLKMNPVEYDWKEKRNKAHDIGVIAQEIEEIIPEVVKESKELNSDETFKSVDYGKMVAVLIKAVQEQQVQIDELKTQIGE